MVQVTYEMMPLFSVILVVFVFLWTLIVGDFKNFTGSKISCTIFTAKDPINCYQNFIKTNGKKHSS